MYNGDYAAAREEFRTAALYGDENTVRAAEWGLARTEFIAENFPAALEALRAFVGKHPETAQAWLLLGETYFTLGRYQESAEAYSVYAARRPGLLDDYIQERRGDALTYAASYAEAIAAYQVALNSFRTDSTDLRIKVAQTYSYAGDHNMALQMYDELEKASTNDYAKAQLQLLAGRSLVALGRQEEAYARWRIAVENYPLSVNSYYALVGLVDSGQPVDEFNRGLVDYFAEQYGVALAAFDRYLASTSAHDGTVLHYRALTLRALGQYAEAVSAWDKFIQGYPENRYWAAAWSEKATTQWAYLNQYMEAAETLQKYANAAPTSPYAAPYLIQAARIYERANRLEDAARLWETASAQYPSDAGAGEAIFQAGIAHYRRGDYQSALEDFQRGLLFALESSDRARVQLWIGKTQLALGNQQEAQNAWKAGQALDQTDYYSLRARDLLLGIEPFQPAPQYKFEYDLAAERREAANWLLIKFNLPLETDLSGPGELANNPQFQRGMEFWQVGLYDNARLEFEALRKAVQSDASNCFRLGNHLLDIGLYRPGIFALRQVLTLSGLDEHSASLAAPPYFGHVRYGFYYAELIFPAAAEYGFDPVFITSVIRQESLFEGFVRSNAGARGLMQIIPSTGAGIAEQLGWPPDYTEESLYSPAVSVRMGTYYLNNNRRLLDGDLYAALAAYNSGPGNASIWHSLANGDPDLFLEIVRFKETRDYIRHIYETYSIYRSIYGPAQ